MKDCGISSVLAMEIPQSFPSHQYVCARDDWMLARGAKASLLLMLIVITKIVCRATSNANFVINAFFIKSKAIQILKYDSFIPAVFVYFIIIMIQMICHYC